jgi:hypothetical protein
MLNLKSHSIIRQLPLKLANVYNVYVHSSYSFKFPEFILKIFRDLLGLASNSKEENKGGIA